MAVNIPSRNVPFTDAEGRVTPVWHEFLRSFVSQTVAGTITQNNVASSVTAGNGLTGGGTGNVTLTVGQGSGIAVNADDVSVDIASQTNIIPSLDDEILVSDFSDNNEIRKTQVRNIIELNAPGGADTNIQYNDAGIFGGNSGFTYNGVDTVGIDKIITTTTNGDLTITPNGTGHVTLGGATPVLRRNGVGSADTRCLSFNSNVPYLYGQANDIIIYPGATGWTIQSNTSQTMQVTSGGILISGMQLKRSIDATNTASTTQTQGQAAITDDYHIVTTVANDNDVVTLPGAAGGQYCYVKNEGSNTLQIFPASGDDLGQGVNTSTYVNAGALAIFIAKDATTWTQISGVMRNSIAAGITASTTQTQGQQPLTRDVNEISTVANANDVVTLPSAPTYSRTVKIINNGANTLQIFPASGDNLGAGVDTSTTLAAGSNVSYTNYNATNWEVI